MPDPKREDLSQDFAASRPEFIFGDDDDDDDNETAPIEECPVNDDDHDPSGGYELYALLGLAQDTKVSNADIRDAFRRLAETFHPDKYHPSRRRAAERHFKRIQYAYDTLTDPQKRVVYDLLGAEGLKREYSVGGSMRSAKGKEVGQKNLTPHEFRRWFIGEMKKRERRELESLIESRVCTYCITNLASWQINDFNHSRPVADICRPASHSESMPYHLSPPDLVSVIMRFAFRRFDLPASSFVHLSEYHYLS